MSDPIEDIFNRHQVAEYLLPDDILKQLEALAQVVSPVGDIIPRKAAPFRSPLVLDWNTASSLYRKRVARAGKLRLFSAHAVTPPSSGDTIINLQSITAGSGLSTIAQMRIPRNTNMNDEQVDVEVNAGSWLIPSVQQTGGASNINVSVEIRIGGM